MEIIYNALSRLGLTAGSKAAPAGAVKASVSATPPTSADETVTASPAETNPHTQPKKITKRRKSQSEEDYEAQKNEFWATGPIVQESDKDVSRLLPIGSSHCTDNSSMIVSTPLIRLASLIVQHLSMQLKGHITVATTSALWKS